MHRIQAEGGYMNKFVLKYSPVIWVLLVAVSLVFAAACAINIIDAVNVTYDGAARKIFAVIIAALSFALLIISLSVIVYGRYVVKDGYLYCRLGFFYVKSDINSIFQLTEFKAQKKLVIFFVGEKYSVALIREKDYAAFYKALIAVNPNIVYTVQSADEK